MAEQAEMIKFGIVFEGAEKAAAEMSALATGAKRIGADVDKLAPSLRNAGTAAQQMGGSMATAGKQAATGLNGMQEAGRKAGTVIGSLGGAVGQLSPQLGQLTGGIGRASAAMGAFGSLAGGPVAIAIGVATLALGELVTWYARTEDAAKAMADAAVKDAERAADALAGLRASIAGRLAAGNPLASQEANVAGATADLAAARSAGSTATQADITNAIRAQTEAINALDRATADLAATEDSRRVDAALSTFEPRGSGGGGSRAARDPNAAKADKFLADSFAMPSSGGSVGTGFDLAGAQSFDAMIEEHAAAGQQMLDAEAMYQSEVDAGRKWAHDEELKRIEERREAEAKSREMALAGAQILGNTMISTLQAVAKGQKVTGKAIVGTIGDQLVASGTKTLWEGIALSANPFALGSGAGMIGVGTSMIAAGIGMGAIGASGGKGGGGGGSRRADNNAPQAVSPNATTRGINNGSNGQPIVINMPTVVSPGAEDGRRVRLALQEADRRGV